MAYRYDFLKRTNNSIANLDNLSTALELDVAFLKEVSEIPPEDRYTSKQIPKSDGKFRTVNNPDQRLRTVQRRINTRIFRPKYRTKNQKGGLITWPSYLFGSVPNNPQAPEDESRDYVSCAAQHCYSKSILKMDISEFFDNIHETHVFSIYKKLLKCPNEVSKYLTDICCHNGNVIQGALTSSFIASAVLFDVEPNVVRKLHTKGLIYTRLVDDITVSSKNHDYDFGYAKALIVQMLHSKGLPTNDNKTVVLGTSSSEALVHGLRVCFKEPRLPSSEVARIRASVKHLEAFAQIPNFITSTEYRNHFNRCLGRVNRLKQVGHNQHKSLIDRVNRIKPKPARKDVKKVRKLVGKIESLYQKYCKGYRYKNLYYKAHYELNILQRTFKLTSANLRKRLRKVRPKYEE